MADRALKLLEDVLMAGQAIAEFTEGHTASTYCADKMLGAAVKFHFIIIGEALKRLRDSHLDVFDTLPEAKLAIEFRNFLAHGYDRIDELLVWDTLTKKLPSLVCLVAEQIKARETGP
jgi:uncharacterized protein with HEPN domain